MILRKSIFFLGITSPQKKQECHPMSSLKWLLQPSQQGEALWPWCWVSGGRIWGPERLRKFFRRPGRPGSVRRWKGQRYFWIGEEHITELKCRGYEWIPRIYSYINYIYLYLYLYLYLYIYISIYAFICWLIQFIVGWDQRPKQSLAKLV